MTTPSRPAASTSGSSTAGSQTLDRGLRALAILAEAGGPLTIAELAEQLGVHRSNAYRILRTLEEHRLVLRDEAGLIRLGPRLVSLARGAAPKLGQMALPEITDIASEFGITAFVAVLDVDEVITLISVEPPLSHASVAQRPGARHSALQGATGHAIEASLSAREHRNVFGGAPLSQAALDTRERGYASSRNEVIPGLTGIAVPLRIEGEPPAAISVVQIGEPDDVDTIVARLHEASNRIMSGSR